MAVESQTLAARLIGQYRIPCMFRIKGICLPLSKTRLYELPESMECDNPMGNGNVVHQCAFGCERCLKRMCDPRVSDHERLFRAMFATMRTADWRIEYGDLQTKMMTGVI